MLTLLQSFLLRNGDYYLHMGSIAHDISTGDIYSINSAGTWYNQDGSGAANG